MLHLMEILNIKYQIIIPFLNYWASSYEKNLLVHDLPTKTFQKHEHTAENVCSDMTVMTWLLI